MAKAGNTSKVIVTWSRTIQVQSYEPERVEITVDAEAPAEDVGGTIDHLLSIARERGQKDVDERLKDLGRAPVAPAEPAEPDPFV